MINAVHIKGNNILQKAKKCILLKQTSNCGFGFHLGNADHKLNKYVVGCQSVYSVHVYKIAFQHFRETITLIYVKHPVLTCHHHDYRLAGAARVEGPHKTAGHDRGVLGRI